MNQIFSLIKYSTYSKEIPLHRAKILNLGENFYYFCQNMLFSYFIFATQIEEKKSSLFMGCSLNTFFTKIPSKKV